MNNVDDDTIIIMMMNGDRKLTKYTPFIHSIIHSMDQWIEQPFYSYQYYWVWMMNWFFTIFNIHLHFESAIFHPLIDWLIVWVNEWVVCVILKNTTFHPNIELWNHDWYYYELQLSSIKHIRFDSIIIKLINPCFVTHW